MVEKSDVAAVLELIRPSLQADGGDVQLVDVSEDGVVTVELQGACKGCHVPDDAGQRRGAHPEGARARCDERGAGCLGGNDNEKRAGSAGPAFLRERLANGRLLEPSRMRR